MARTRARPRIEGPLDGGKPQWLSGASGRRGSYGWLTPPDDGPMAVGRTRFGRGQGNPRMSAGQWGNAAGRRAVGEERRPSERHAEQPTAGGYWTLALHCVLIMAGKCSATVRDSSGEKSDAHGGVEPTAMPVGCILVELALERRGFFRNDTPLGPRPPDRRDRGPVNTHKKGRRVGPRGCRSGPGSAPMGGQGCPDRGRTIHGLASQGESSFRGSSGA